MAIAFTNECTTECNIPARRMDVSLQPFGGGCRGSLVTTACYKLMGNIDRSASLPKWSENLLSASDMEFAECVFGQGVHGANMVLGMGQTGLCDRHLRWS